MDGYLPKPVDGEQLSAEIARVLELRSPERATATRAPDVPLWSADVLEQLRLLDGPGAPVSKEILELFRVDGLRIMTSLRDAVRAGDPASIARLTHELQGAASTVGAARVVARSRALESTAKLGGLAEASRAFEALAQAIDETHRTLTEDRAVG